MLRIPLIFFLSSLAVSILPAQDAVVSVRTLQLSGGDMPEAWVMLQGEKEPAELKWLTTQPTQPLDVTHDGTLKLYHYITDANGKKTLSVSNSIKIPGASKEILLLGAAGEQGGMYIAIKDVFKTARFNDWLAINTSNQTVAMRAGEKGKPVVIEAGKSSIFSPDVEEGKGVKILALAVQDGEVKPFYSTYWPAFSGQRTMIIFYRDQDRMRARRIGDYFIPSDDEE